MRLYIVSVFDDYTRTNKIYANVLAESKSRALIETYLRRYTNAMSIAGRQYRKVQLLQLSQKELLEELESADALYCDITEQPIREDRFGIDAMQVITTQVLNIVLQNEL